MAINFNIVVLLIFTRLSKNECNVFRGNVYRTFLIPRSLLSALKTNLDLWIIISKSYIITYVLHIDTGSYYFVLKLIFIL